MYNWKTFDIDFDDINEVRKLRGIMSQRFIELTHQKKILSEDPRIKRGIEFDLINKIYETDISPIYENLDEERKYYVYAHYDENIRIKAKRPKDAFASISFGMKYRPFYIGKGTGSRYLTEDRNYFYQHYKKNLRLPPIYEIIKDKLTETEALCIESKLIDIFGLIPYSGYLTNLDEGQQSIVRRRMYPVECWKMFPVHIQDQLNSI